MTVRFLRDDEKPTSGFIRRSHPIWLEFAKQMTWFTRLEVRPNGTPGMVYVWVLKVENKEYERGVDRKRYCKTYRGRPINLEDKVSACE